MKVGVTGANGFIGSHTVEQLLREGHEVTCLVRRTSDLLWIRNLDVELAYGDVTEPACLSSFVAGKDAVIHLAGIINSTAGEKVRAVNVEGTRRLLEAIERVNPALRRFVFVSSQEAAGPNRSDQPLIEEGPLAPDTVYGRSKAEAEAVVHSFDGRVACTIIRPPSVYGPRDTNTFILFRLIKRGILPFPTTGARISVVAIENLVRGILLALANDAACGRCYYISDDDAYSWEELGGYVEESLGTRAFRLPIPLWVLGVGSVMADVFRLLSGREGILNREKLHMMAQRNLTVSNERAKAEIGYLPQMTTREGITETVRWYRDQGWL